MRRPAHQNRSYTGSSALRTHLCTKVSVQGLKLHPYFWEISANWMIVFGLYPHC